MARRPEESPRVGEQKSLWQRMAWLVVIWSASVLALGVVAWLLRLAMSAAGLATP